MDFTQDTDDTAPDVAGDTIDKAQILALSAGDKIKVSAEDGDNLDDHDDDNSDDASDDSWAFLG